MVENRVNALDAETINPYQSPAADPADAIRVAMDQTLRTRSRVEFKTEITGRDVRTALLGKAFRRDLAGLRRAGLWMMIPVALIFLLLGVRWFRGGALRGVPLGLVAGLMGLVLYATAIYLWLVHKHVQANSGLVGPIQGWMDRELLWIEDEDQIRVRPIKHLVGVTRNKDQIVLCFDTTHTLFETLPLRGFEDPDTALILADQLARARPFENMMPLDPRRRQVPTDDPLFEVGTDPHFFAGQLLTDDIKGTPLAAAQRRQKWKIVAQLLTTLGIASLGVLVISFSVWLSIFAVSIVALAFVRGAIRVFRAPLVGQADKGVMFYTSGWIDREHVVTISSIGQTRTRWSAFEESVMTDRVISLKLKTGSLWYLIGRGQFADPTQWEAACRFVRERMQG